jgi:hypothetical protein
MIDSSQVYVTNEANCYQGLRIVELSVKLLIVNVLPIQSKETQKRTLNQI